MRFRELALRERFAISRGDQWLDEICKPYITSFEFWAFFLASKLILPLIAEHLINFRLGREMQHWEVKRQNVIFSEESRFCLGMHNGRRSLRCCCGEFIPGTDMDNGLGSHNLRYPITSFVCSMQHNSYALHQRRATTHTTFLNHVHSILLMELSSRRSS